MERHVDIADCIDESLPNTTNEGNRNERKFTKTRETKTYSQHSQTNVCRGDQQLEFEPQHRESIVHHRLR